MKTLRTLLLALSAALAFSSVQATTVVAPTFDELVSQAELIFQGTVSDVKSQWTGEGAQRHIVTYVTFTVDEPLKGEAGTSYTLRMLGGTVGDQTMEVTESPKFKVGDRDIVFVENNGKQFVPLVGIMHGRFRVEKSQTGGDVVLNNHRQAVKDVAELGKPEALGRHLHSNAAADATQTLGAADFKAAIRSKLTAAR